LVKWYNRAIGRSQTDSEVEDEATELQENVEEAGEAAGHVIAEGASMAGA